MPEAIPYPILFLSEIQRRFTDAERTIEILKGADLAIWEGQSVALIAPSGTGKSTLLQLAGLLERPDSGDVYIGARSTAGLDDDGRTAMRRDEIGFVYQQHRLLPDFTALENVMMPQMIGGLQSATASERAKEVLGFLGLAERLNHRPSELSGGEQQRVAIARAVANRPRILLADEPTGNLDPKTSALVFDTLMALARVSGLAALVATHNLELAARMDRRVTLRDGIVIELD